MPISKIELKSYGFQIGDDSLPSCCLGEDCGSGIGSLLG